MKGTLNLVISSTNLFCNELLQSLYTIVYCPELISWFDIVSNSVKFTLCKTVWSFMHESEINQQFDQQIFRVLPFQISNSVNLSRAFYSGTAVFPSRSS